MEMVWTGRPWRNECGKDSGIVVLLLFFFEVVVVVVVVVVARDCVVSSLLTPWIVGAGVSIKVKKRANVSF